MREGDVVLTPVPQADGAIKNRPAIILRVRAPSYLSCAAAPQFQRYAAIECWPMIDL